MSPEDIEAANAVHPDLVGFIFAKKSRRCITPANALAFRAMLDPTIKAVGVYVDAAVDEILEAVSQGSIQVVQLHGHEDETYIETLRMRLSEADHGEIAIIKAFRLDKASDVARVNASAADGCLVDSGDGGTGTCFDWELLDGITRPYFLAGGLNPENVAAAVTHLQPYGVDVSSGIETDGKKDSKKMARFVDAVRKSKI